LTWSQAQLAGCITEGLYAQRKLQGDASVYGPENHDVLQAIVSQGKKAEATLRQEGSIAYIRHAYERAGEAYPGEVKDGKPGTG